MGKFVKRISFLLAFVICVSTVFTHPIALKAETRTITCATTEEIFSALKNAQPGDTIVIKAGTYTGAKTTSGYSNAYFYMNKSGTPELPIIIQGEFSSNKPVLQGTTNTSGYVFYLVGSNVKIKNLKLTNGAQGLMIDKSTSNTIYGCEVYGIGQEGIHLRDGSSKVVIDSCNIHDVGLANPGYGEGIYVGSDNGKWATYAKECDDNKIKRTTIGPNVAAEHIDVKEGTTGTIIEDSFFYGKGISGANYADSFIDVKGNNVLITRNQFFQEENNIIVDGIQTREQLVGWGTGIVISDNTFNMSNATEYMVNSVKVTTTVSNNVRTPAGNLYKGSIIQQ